MPVNDDAQILEIPLKAVGVKSGDWSSVRANDLTALNNVLRQMQEQIHKLTGRTGDAAIRSGLSVTGNLVSEGNLSAGGGNLSLGGVNVSKTNPSFAPTLEDALSPAAFDYAPIIGAKADLLPANPFTWTLAEHFIGGGAGAGAVGELGWSFTAGVSVFFLAGEASHPGILTFDTNGVPTGGLYLLNSLLQGELSYFAAVARLAATFRTSWRVGFLDPSTGGADTSQGAYFSYDFSVSPNWQTVTRSAAGVEVTTTSTPVAQEDWLLLEIVFNTDSVDFFINRERLTRHTGTSLDPATVAFLGTSHTENPAGVTVDYDRFVASGRGADKIWT